MGLNENKIRNSILLALFGAYLAVTRFVGLGVVGLPLIAEVFREKRLRSFKKSLSVVGVSLLGVFAYFSYLQIKFGDWKIFFEVQEKGWHKTMDFGVFFRSATYAFWLDPNTSVFHLTLLCFVGIVGVEVSSYFTKGNVRKHYEFIKIERLDRGLFYLAAFGLFYISAGFSSAKGYESMLRYSFPVHILLLLGIGLRFKKFTIKNSYLDQLGLLWPVPLGFSLDF
ncbi:MAG: hypothetical protein ABIQ95_14515 [Bdellovibrionia bacterium]